MLELFFKYRRVIARFRRGALGNEIDHIASDLHKVGYKRDSAKLYLARIAHFSEYAMRFGCGKLRAIPHHIVDRYLRARPTILTRLAAQVAIGHAVRRFPARFTRCRSHEKPDPDGPLIESYRQHLQGIRGLHPKTCERLVLTARRMLIWRRKHLARKSLSAITAKHVLDMTRGLLSACRTDSARSQAIAHIRSFLRYLHWADLNAQDLARFVPRTPCWRHTHLPPRLAWEEIRRTIDVIEGSSPSDLRDRAIMLLLATTGMRNRELRELELGDIGWRRGELLLRHTKGHRDRVVPLLKETGAALADYILHARPQCSERRVFLTLVPPVRPLAHSGTVSEIVRTRLRRAGISIQKGGAHLLRHSLATQLVAQRRPIKEVADLLGHQNIDTTSFYVKVAVPQLAEVALPFPGGAS